jgi:GT2 family glycosyltransferase
MDLSVIILNFNTKNLLRDCLSSVLQQTQGINFEIIIVDNGSTDGSVEMIEELRIKNKGLRIIKNKKNLGFAKANNQGIRKAAGDYVFLLNSDTFLKKNSLLKLVEFAKDHPQAGGVGPRLLNKDGSKQPSVAPFFTLPRVFLWLLTGDRFLFSSPDTTRQVDWVMGAALLIKKEVFKKTGLLDEHFFMYLEEVEWCYRLKKAGWQIWFYPGAEIFHLVRGSSPEGKQRAIWGICQGLIYFYRKHFAPWQLIVLKFLLRTKAAGAWLIGILSFDQDLKETYAKAFKMVK